MEKIRRIIEKADSDNGKRKNEVRWESSLCPPEVKMRLVS
jgi:hypothetical protein